MVALSLSPLALPQSYETHVWQLYLPDALAYRSHWLTWLSPDEYDRYQRFYRDTDRDRFLLGRGGLRYLLARYLGCCPSELTFTYSSYGKPDLVAPPKSIYFNLAHSGTWVVYGISRSGLIGVDVETITDRSYLDALIQRCLTPKEQATLPPSLPDRLKGFLQYWTVKEAHLKAVGSGLSYPMTQIQVDWREKPVLVCPAKTAAAPPNPWTVDLWWPAAEAIAAVCVGQAQSHIAIRPFPLTKPGF